MEITNAFDLQKFDKVDLIFRSSHLVVNGVKVCGIYDDTFGVCVVLDGYVPAFSFDTYFADIVKKVIIVPFGRGLDYKRRLYGF